MQELGVGKRHRKGSVLEKDDLWQSQIAAAESSVCNLASVQRGRFETGRYVNCMLSCL